MIRLLPGEMGFTCLIVIRAKVHPGNLFAARFLLYNY